MNKSLEQDYYRSRIHRIKVLMKSAAKNGRIDDMKRYMYQDFYDVVYGKVLESFWRHYALERMKYQFPETRPQLSDLQRFNLETAVICITNFKEKIQEFERLMAQIQIPQLNVEGGN